MTGKNFLKRCWKTSPQSLRCLLLGGLCLLRAQKRVTVADAAPLFVCGAFRSSSGLAHSARLYAQHQQRMGADVLLVDITATMLQQRDFTPAEEPLDPEQILNTRGRGTVVIHANPPQFQLALCKLGKDFLRGKRLIGYWAWELETIPDIWRQALQYVDEVEVPSSFVQRALQGHTDKKISVVPHDVPQPAGRKTAYAEDGVLRCLYIFDAASSFERKNPLAALKAFELAFAPGEAELTFKISNYQADDKAFAVFQNACARVPGVCILAETLSPPALEELYLRHDVYLSLHRSEGYGLTIREAMLHGLHVVGTGWSGNMDFMSGELAHPVPYALVPANLNCGPYKGLKATWAEADVREAAEILQKVRRSLLNQRAHV